MSLSRVIIIFSGFLCFSDVFAVSQTESEKALQKWEQKFKKEEDLFKKHEGLKKLLKRYPSSVPVHLRYLKSLSRLKQASQAVILYQKLAKEQTDPIYQFLSLMAQKNALGWSQKDAKKKQQLLKEMKGLKTDSQLSFYVLNQLARGLDDGKERLKHARNLIKSFPEKRKAQTTFAFTLADQGLFDELLTLCKRTSQTSSYNFDTCFYLGRVKGQLDKKQKLALDEQVANLKLIGSSQILNFTQLEDLYDVFKSLKKEQESHWVAEKIVNKDPSWVPVTYLKDYGVTDYQSYQLYSQLKKAKNHANVKQRPAEVNKVLPKLAAIPKLASLGYKYLAAIYEHPMTKDLSKEVYSLEQSLKLAPKSIGGKVKLAKSLLKKKAKLDQAVKLLQTAEKELMILPFNQDGYASHGFDFLKNQKEYLQYIYLLKGQLLLVKKDFDGAAETLSKALSLGYDAEIAFNLGEAERKRGNELAAKEWYLVSLAKAKESFKEEDLKTAQKQVKLISSRLYAQPFELESSVSWWKNKLTKEQKEEEEVHPLLNKKIPSVNLNTVQGQPFDWSSLKGKLVVLSFWATWCPPCMMEFPILNKIHKNLDHNKAVVVSICVDGLSNTDRVQEIIKEGKYTLPVLLGSDDLKKDFQFAGIPSLFIFDKEGTVRDVHVGYDSEMERVILKKIKKFL